MDDSNLTENQIYLEACKLYTRDPKSAAEKIERGRAFMPEDPEVDRLLGISYHASKQYEKAIDTFNAYITHKPEDNVIRNRIAHCYFNLERFDEARECLETILNKNSQDIEALSIMADTERKSGNYDKAIEFYDKVIKRGVKAKVNFGWNYKFTFGSKERLAINAKRLEQIYIKYGEELLIWDSYKNIKKIREDTNNISIIKHLPRDFKEGFFKLGMMLSILKYYTFNFF